jgi:hypothetical protein
MGLTLILFVKTPVDHVYELHALDAESVAVLAGHIEELFIEIIGGDELTIYFVLTTQFVPSVNMAW